MNEQEAWAALDQLPPEAHASLRLEGWLDGTWEAALILRLDWPHPPLEWVEAHAKGDSRAAVLADVLAQVQEPLARWLAWRAEREGAAE